MAPFSGLDSSWKLIRSTHTLPTQPTPSMRSDHWNFLANLLGTPGPAEPPQEKEAEPTPSTAAKQDVTRERAIPGEAAEQNSHDEPSSTIDSAEDVIEALTSAVTSPRLPGFGPAHRAKDAELEELTAQPETRELPEASDSSRPPRDSSSSQDRVTEVSVEESGSQDDESDQAWGALAGELGIVAVEPPRQHVPRTSEPTRPRRPSSDSSKPPKRRSSGGFGSGLGLDIEPEPIDEDDDDDDDILSSRNLFVEVGDDDDGEDDEVKVIRDRGPDRGASPRGRDREEGPRGRDREEGRSRGGRQPRGRARSYERPRDEARDEKSTTHSFVDDDLDDDRVVDKDDAPQGRGGVIRSGRERRGPAPSRTTRGSPAKQRIGCQKQRIGCHAWRSRCTTSRSPGVERRLTATESR